MSDAIRNEILDLEIPPECEEGVKANLAILAEHFRLVADFEIPE